MKAKWEVLGYGRTGLKGVIKTIRCSNCGAEREIYEQYMYEIKRCHKCGATMEGLK